MWSWKRRRPAIYRVLACQLHITEDFTLVDDQHVGVRVGGERLLQPSLLAGVGEIFDQFRRRSKKRLEAVLDGTIADGHGQMRLPAPGLAVEDEGASLADQLGSQTRAEQRQAQRGLEREIELLHGLEERKVGAPRQMLQTRLLSSRHLLRQQESEEVRVGPAFLLGLHRDLLVDAAHVGQVETLEQSLAFRLGEAPALRTGVVGVTLHNFTSWEKSFAARPRTPTPSLRCRGGAPPERSRGRRGSIAVEMPRSYPFTAQPPGKAGNVAGSSPRRRR